MDPASTSFAQKPPSNQDVAIKLTSSILRKVKTPADFLLLFDANFAAIEPANFFLLDHCYWPNLSRKWKNFQSAYAYDLAQYWTYLENNDLPWDQIKVDDLRDYERGLLTGFSAKGAEFRPQTVQRRVGTVLEFYRWAQSKSLLPQPLPGIERGRSWSAAGRSTAVDEKIRPFRLPDLRRVLDSLGPQSTGPLLNELNSTRDRLTAELALYTGMRISEIAALTVLQILNAKSTLDQNDIWRPARLSLIETKGKYPRVVAVPAFLIKALIIYIDGERETVLRQALDLGKFTQGVPYALFLNTITPNLKHAAEAVKADTLSRAFTKAVLKCGLVERKTVLVFDTITGDPIIDPVSRHPVQQEISVAAYTFHDLRHTFAVQIYHSEIKRGNPSPWKKIQVRLGHRHMSTTQNIYLRYVDTDEADLSDHYVSFIRQMQDELI